MGRNPMGEKAADFKGTMIKLLGYMKRYLPMLIIALVCAIAGTAFSILGPKILGKATTKLFEGLMAMIAGTGSIDFDALAQILLFLGGLYLFSALLNYVQGWLMSGIATRVSYTMRTDISQKIDRLPMSYFDKVSHGEVLSRITNDVDSVTQTLNQSLSQVVTQVTLLLGVLIMMLSISPWMTLVALCILPVCLIIVTSVIRHSQKFFRSQQEYLGHVNGHVEEMYGAHVVVTAFNGQEDSIRDFNEMNEKLYHSAWKSQFLSGLMMPLMNFASNLGYVAICVLGGFLALNQAITVGDIQAFIQYVRQFTQPINQLANISNQLQLTAAAAERVFLFLEEPEEEADPVPAIDPESIDGSVQFAHVNFGYLPDKTIIHDFSASIQPGTKVAIVGPTGAGKTTIVKLLMRFYDVNQGAILLSGYDVRQFARGEMRDAFGMVLQAAKAAQVDHFVRTLPHGYDTVLNEDASNISQGQKQLLTIARTILSDPKILILDEATSSVDTRTEVAIQTAMDRLTQGRTSFIIAHRLSTIRNADVILVMKDGDIVETGTHQQLLEQNGFYANLYNSQFATT